MSTKPIIGARKQVKFGGKRYKTLLKRGWAVWSYEPNGVVNLIYTGGK